MQYKRQRQYDLAVDTWLKLSERASELALEALEELAIHFEHHRCDPKRAMEFTLAALGRLREQPRASIHPERFTHRLARLQQKNERLQGSIKLPMA